MYTRLVRGIIAVGVALTPVAAAAQSKPPTNIAGCPAEVRSWHHCALQKAKTFMPPRAPSGKPDFQGYWRPSRITQIFNVEGVAEDNPYVTGLPPGYAWSAGASLIVDPADRKIPYQPWAKEKATMHHAVHRKPPAPALLDPVSRCFEEGVPRINYQGNMRILQFPNQIVVMHEGRIEQAGIYQSLIENPVNLFVAGFLGSPPMNLFPGGFISGEQLILGDTRIPLPERVLALVQNEQRVTLGIRHEAVAVSAEAAPRGAIQLPAEVESLEADYVHRTQTVHLRTGGWNYSGLCPLDVNLRIGQPVHAALDPERLYFFDAKTGLRI